MDFLKQLAKKIFQWQAQLVLKRYKPKIIAITGSVGKTLAKEAIYSVFSKRFFVRKSEKSFTAELGVALTIIGCPRGAGSVSDWLYNLLLGMTLLMWKRNYPEYLILEIDGDKPGDLKGVSSFISPDILVMTAIGEVPSHIELFSDMESFLFEKRTIIHAVKREGVIIYNADDSVVLNLLEDTALQKISVGVLNGSDYSGNEFEVQYNEKNVPIGMTFNITSKKETEKIQILSSLGIQNEYAGLLAFAVGSYLNIPQTQIVSSLNKFTSLPGRMNIIVGIKDTVILDDSYNSSPIALEQAISVFSGLKALGKKIAVIGDMLELGKFSADEHKKIAELLHNRVTRVICVGIRARKISEELLNLGFDEAHILSLDTAEEAGQELQNILQPGDIVLVKGSQALRMEKVVEEVMANPKEAKKLLVRQDIDWKNR